MKTQKSKTKKLIRPSIKSQRGRRGGCLLISHEEGITKINIKA